MLEYVLSVVVAIIVLGINITLDPKPSLKSSPITILVYGICFIILSPFIIALLLITKILRND
jgi:hypothetical protein